MKLLHVTATHLRPDGGVPVVLKNLVSEQNKIDNFSAKVISLAAPVDEMDSIYFEYVKISNFGKYVEKFSPDFVILHSFFYLEYNRVVHELKKRKIRYYIEPHGSFGKAALQKSRMKKTIANNTIFKGQLRNAYGFVFLNDAEKNDSKYCTENDIVIPNGMPTCINKKEIRSGKKNSIYFIGRYDINHKGLDYLFDAMDRLEEKGCRIKLYMWGKGEEQDVRYIKNRCVRYKNVEVIIGNSIYGSDKDAMLEQFGPMILTSRYEGFPMTVLEAWKYGNPCIVTSGTNVLEEIQNNKLGWGTKLNGDEIAQTIQKALMQYKEERVEYINRCKNYLEDNYVWSKIAKKSYEILSVKNGK